MFADNERDARAAYHRWLGQGPSGPYNMDFIEQLTDKEGELMQHLAAFMFRQGVEFAKHSSAVDRQLAVTETLLTGLPPMISTLEMTPAKEAEILDALSKPRAWVVVPDESAAKATEDAYHELIMAVSKKYPNETRHETALRYIRQAEQGSSDCAAAAKAN